MNQIITSVQNEKVKNWRKLHQRKNRQKASLFIVEGLHLVEEAVNSNWEVEEIIVEQHVEIPSWCHSHPLHVVGENVFRHISQTKSPQGLAAVVKMKEVKKVVGKKILLIDAVQDPGNLGTIIRTADAAGWDTIILGNGTVDIYNDKVIRATQGSIFHLPIIEANLVEQITELKRDRFTVWASALQEANNYRLVTPMKKIALIIGNEGSGIHASILKMADQIVKIPIYGKAESLNVSVASGVLMYYIADYQS